MHDIVIPYQKNNSGELETCLKLIDKNVPHRKVHIIEQFNNSSYSMLPHINQILKLSWAIDNLDITDKFILFNDDFFVMQPIEDIPHYYRGTLSDHIDSRKHNDFYTRTLKITRDYLRDGALSYELHTPFIFNKFKLKNTLELLEPNINSGICPLIRSVYGNKWKVGGEYLEDVKNIRNYEGSTYLSTTESSFLRQPIGDYIRSKV